VVVSILIMYYNIGLPNCLRGFMYYAQVSLYCVLLKTLCKHYNVRKSQMYLIIGEIYMLEDSLSL